MFAFLCDVKESYVDERMNLEFRDVFAGCIVRRLLELYSALPRNSMLKNHYQWTSFRGEISNYCVLRLPIWSLVSIWRSIFYTSDKSTPPSLIHQIFQNLSLLIGLTNECEMTVKQVKWCCIIFLLFLSLDIPSHPTDNHF